jgi:hypothetical protein
MISLNLLKTVSSGRRTNNNLAATAPVTGTQQATRLRANRTKSNPQCRRRTSCHRKAEPQKKAANKHGLVTATTRNYVWRNNVSTLAWLFHFVWRGALSRNFTNEMANRMAFTDGLEPGQNELLAINGDALNDVRGPA